MPVINLPSPCERGTVILVSGERGAGKTAALLRVREAALDAGLTAGGFLSVARFAGGEKVGIDVMDAATGSLHSLAELGEGGVLRTGRYRFHPAARLAAIRLDARLTTRDAFARPGKSEPNRLPLEDFGKTLIPKECGSTNPGKGSVAFWRPAAAWDGKQVVTAFDFGWRNRRNANDITYVIALNRVGPDQPNFASSMSSVVASTTRADQAVANPALAAGPDGQVLLVYEHDRGVDRQTIQALAVGKK